MRAPHLIAWSNGVTVSTLDFESSDGGSNPPWTFFLHRRTRATNNYPTSTD